MDAKFGFKHTNHPSITEMKQLIGLLLVVTDDRPAHIEEGTLAWAEAQANKFELDLVLIEA